MKFSYYNIIVPYNETYLLYNTANGTFVRIPKEAYSTDNQQLKELGFIVSDEQDEIQNYKYRYLSGLFNTSTYHLTIATTLGCNFSCPYCFEDKNKNGDSLTEHVINSIQTYILHKKIKRLNITWFGGEPFLNFNAIKRLSEFLLENKINFSSIAITNGSILTKSIVEKLDKYHVNSLQITLDGYKDTHNRTRSFKNGKDSFDLIISNIDRVLEYSSSKIILRINLDKINCNNFIELKKFIFSRYKNYINESRLILSPTYIRDRTSFKDCNNCFSPIEYYEYERKILKQRPQLPTLMGPCQLRTLNGLIIGPDGEIYKCLELLGVKSQSVGNITTSSLTISKLADFALGSLPFENPKCSNCKFLPICGGGCAIDLRRNKEPHCPALKEKIEEIMIEYYEYIK